MPSGHGVLVTIILSGIQIAKLQFSERYIFQTNDVSLLKRCLFDAMYLSSTVNTEANYSVYISIISISLLEYSVFSWLSGPMLAHMTFSGRNCKIL